MIIIVKFGSRLLFACLLLAQLSCSSGIPINDSFPSKNFKSRVDYLVLHFTVGDFSSALKQLTEGEVSSHYLVSAQPPVVYRLVPDDLRAFHAGESYWNGVIGLNQQSIGIEIVNAGCEGELEPQRCAPYPNEQIDLVVKLIRKIVTEHGIKPSHVLGHSDIAPGRKLDPGPRFPWERLAKEGLVAWPNQETIKMRRAVYEETMPDPVWFQYRLAAIGYRMPQRADYSDTSMRNTLRSVQMKYRPNKCDGLPDAETAAIVDVLANL